MYEQISSKINFVEMERQILEFWEKNKTFEKSLRVSDNEHIFYDGPPFPTGSPHHGSVFVSILKDALGRYFTMAGKYVPRAWGWDCHGLPIENKVEKLLNIKNKTQIEKEITIKKFNQECRNLVLNFNKAWEEYITRIGRWVDFHHPYRTMDKTYMESVIWVFSECFKKGLIYRDFRVTPYCYRCETSLSISDTRESDSTRPKQDPAIIIKFKSLKDINNKPSYFLAWTTTPWTLIGNLALAVGKKIQYAVIDTGKENWILAGNLLSQYNKLWKTDYTASSYLTGEEIEGWQYQPVFSYLDKIKDDNNFRVLISDFVTTDEGVGIVHIAPAYGEDDYWLCRKSNIQVYNIVNEQGCFKEEITGYAGRNVHEATGDIIKELKQKNVLVDNRTISHNYPHCWRCRTPLIYYAMSAWYFNIEKIKNDLLEQNQKINWVPESVKNGRFGNWLEGARDWNLSRNRYWGTPIPIWECDNPACSKQWIAGSCRDIEEKAGHPVDDLHKEFLDEITFQCECNGTMKRIPEVLDCWFESGAMPYAQCHYPFENSKWFISHFPSDFIVEYPGQIRGWFYYLHVLGVALMKQPAFKNCLVHGTFLTEDGSKMSKSRKNFTDPLILINEYGADALRAYLLGSPATVMSDLCFKNEGISEQIKEVLLPLWNAYYFFVTYANIDNYKGDINGIPSPGNELDQWIMSKFYKIEKIVKNAFESYQLNLYFTPLKEFIDNLTNWYIRNSRSRAWEGGFSSDKKCFYDTLYYILINLVKIIAPSLPFISEKIYKGLTGDESVHLTYWPDIPGKFNNDKLELKVDLARKIVNLGLSLRQKVKIKVRQPLQKCQIVLPGNIVVNEFDSQLEVIRDGLNIKEIEFIKDIESIAKIRANINVKKLGPQYGSEVQEIIKSAKAGRIKLQGDKVLVLGNEREWLLDADDVTIGYEGAEGFNIMSDRGIVVSIDTKINDALLEEGISNELTRHIQVLRKDAGYDIMDKIYLQISGASLSGKSLSNIGKATFAEFLEIPDPDIEKEITINSVPYLIRIKKQG